jgi:glyoxylase-like metal-dependent hydrolase (beta-lactamase superfamily II)
LDGTRSFLVGTKDVVVIDPGPDVKAHVRALSFALSGSGKVRILLTHAHHDHAGGAGTLAESLPARVLGPPSAGFEPLRDGEVVPSDQGDLVAVATPGHTKDHLAFFWPRGGALFAGDLLLGRGVTTWLGEYLGCVADYLDSLEKVRKLAPRVVYPAHGGPLRDPPSALNAFRAHRLARLEEVGEIRRRRPSASVEEILTAVYGEDLASRASRAARSSIEVMLHHLGLPVQGG